MSVVKSKRNKSKVEFEMIYFQMADGIDFLVEHNFFADGLLAEKNKIFLEIRARSLEELTDQLLYYIKMANSIYPTCMGEYEEKVHKSRRQLVAEIFSTLDREDFKYIV